MNRGRGRGGSRGYGRMRDSFYADMQQPAPQEFVEDDLEFLKNRADQLQDELSAIISRVNELDKKE